MLSIISTLLVLPLLLLFYNYYWKRRGLPPGPTPHPLIGNTLDLAKNPPGYKAFQDCAKKYGPIYTFWLGEEPVVMLTDYELMKQTIVRDGDAYIGAHAMVELSNHLTEKGAYGIFRTGGDEWRNMRRFSLLALRNLGMGKNSMETKIFYELNEILMKIETDISNGVEEHHIIPLADLFAGSTINQLVFGQTFHRENLKEFVELKKLLSEIEESIGSPSGAVLMGLPWLRHLPFFSAKFKQIDSHWSHLYAYFTRHIQESLQDREAKGNKDDRPCESFVDLFLNEMEKGNGSNESEFHLNSLKALCSDLFVAGQQTTSRTLTFSILYLLLDQRVQQRMQKELDEKIAENRPITSSDRASLPYTNAVINECQRLCNLLVNNLTHTTTRDVEICGHRLKKGTIIVPQISCVLYDEKIFPSPEEFKPERFIGSNGQLKKIDELIPFSIGKRQCLGESLAKMELFLFLTNFFHQYKVYPTNPLLPPNGVEKAAGIGVVPNYFTCRLEKRFEKS